MIVLVLKALTNNCRWLDSKHLANTLVLARAVPVFFRRQYISLIRSPRIGQQYCGLVHRTCSQGYWVWLHIRARGSPCTQSCYPFGVCEIVTSFDCTGLMDSRLWIERCWSCIVVRYIGAFFRICKCIVHHEGERDTAGWRIRCLMFQRLIDVSNVDSRIWLHFEALANSSAWNFV